MKQRFAAISERVARSVVATGEYGAGPEHIDLDRDRIKLVRGQQINVGGINLILESDIIALGSMDVMNNDFWLKQEPAEFETKGKQVWYG